MATDVVFREVAKDRLYYDRWHYSMNFYVPEASALRELDHDNIDHVIRARQRWRELSQRRRNRSNILITGHARHQITELTITNLHALADVLIRTPYEFKSVVSINTVWVYTNNVALFDEILDLNFVMLPAFSQAVIRRPRNTVVLRNPRHSQRSYFRMAKLTADQKNQLVRFFRNSQSYVRLSPALTQWLDNSFLRLQDYFFVDHSTDQWQTLLNLVHPGLIRKTMQIQQTK